MTTEEARRKTARLTRKVSISVLLSGKMGSVNTDRPKWKQKTSLVYPIRCTQNPDLIEKTACILKTFLKIHCLPSHKAKLRKSQKIELIQTVFSVHNEAKLKVNNKKSFPQDN